MNKFVQTDYIFFSLIKLVQLNVSANEHFQQRICSNEQCFFCILVQMNISIKKFVQIS